MKKIKNLYPSSKTIPDFICPKNKRPLFFDIETTGFSRENCTIYLIGCAYTVKGGYEIVQFFAENTTDEQFVLSEFGEFSENFDVLISFNGIKFDQPFIEARCRRYNITCKLNSKPHIDILAETRKFSKLLPINNLKQKTIEAFLGIERKDEYNGGELIDIYLSYCVNPHPDKEQLLLLHNKEDVEGMTDLLSIFLYNPILNADLSDTNSIRCYYSSSKGNSTNLISNLSDYVFSPDKSLNYSLSSEDAVDLDSQINNSDNISSDNYIQNIQLRIVIPLKSNIVRQIYCSSHNCHIIMNKCDLTIVLPVYSDELKHFFDDYRNYYYIPSDDTAIHKSVAQFIEPSNREKAKASTCYQRKKGLFILNPRGVIEPVFKKEYRSKEYFLELGLSKKNLLSGLDIYLKAVLEL